MLKIRTVWRVVSFKPTNIRLTHRSASQIKKDSECNILY
jgi:hypothetical protein